MKHKFTELSDTTILLSWHFVACCTVKSVGRVSNRYGIRNEESSFHTGVCRQPRQSWAAMWQDMQWFQ
jgi:hypothetical protein